MTAEPKIPTYDEAHRVADTMFPPDLWCVAHNDLSAVRNLFWQFAVKSQAKVRFVLGSKHPFPGCFLCYKRGWRETEIAVRAQPSEKGLVYVTDIKKTYVVPVLGVSLPPQFEALGTYSRTEIAATHCLNDLSRIIEKRVVENAG